MCAFISICPFSYSCCTCRILFQTEETNVLWVHWFRTSNGDKRLLCSKGQSSMCSDLGENECQTFISIQAWTCAAVPNPALHLCTFLCLACIQRCNEKIMPWYRSNLLPESWRTSAPGNPRLWWRNLTPFSGSAYPTSDTTLEAVIANVTSQFLSLFQR